MRKYLPIIALIVFNIIISVFSVIMMTVLDMNWFKWVIIISVSLSILGGCGLAIYRAFKNKRQVPKEKKARLTQEMPDLEYLKKTALQLLKDRNAEHLVKTSIDQISHIGEEGTVKTPIYCLAGTGYYTDLFWAVLINIIEDTFSIISGKSYEDIVANGRLRDATNKLAENPEIRDIEEKTITVDELGRRIESSRTTRQTRKQIEQEIKEKQEQERESIPA